MRSMKSSLWLGVLAVGIVLGIVTAIRVFTTGFVLYAKTDVLVWTLPLAAYIFFSLTSSGLAFVSSIPVVFGLKKYEPLEKRTVFLEIAVLLAAFVCLVLHLGSPLNAVYFLLSPNPASPLWWLGILYGVYFAALLASFWKMHTARVSHALSTLVFLIAIGTSTMLGWLFGLPDGRPVFSGAFLTMYFPLTALACGLAAILLFSLASNHFAGSEITGERTALYNDTARVFGIVAAITLVFFLWKSVIGGLSATEPEFAGLKRMMGSWSYHVALWVGLVAPIVLMFSSSVRKTTWGKVLASGMFLGGMLFGRLEFLLSGELMPLGALAEGRPMLVSYTPTIWELFVPAFALSVMLLLYTLGERYLRLDAPHEGEDRAG